MNNQEKIAVFCCENSGLKAAELLKDADLLQRIEIVRLPCSGKIEIALILKTLEKGYAGALVLGCPEDNCKFMSGSTRAKKRIGQVRQILANAGLDGSAVAIELVSSVDTHKVEIILQDMLERLFESRPATT